MEFLSVYLDPCQFKVFAFLTEKWKMFGWKSLGELIVAKTSKSHKLNHNFLPNWQWSSVIPIMHISLIIQVIKDGGHVIGYDTIHYVMRNRQNGPCPLPAVRVTAISQWTWNSHPETMWDCKIGNKAKYLCSCNINSNVKCSPGKFSLIHWKELVDLMVIKIF